MSYIFTTDRTVHVFLILTTTLVREAHFSHSNEVIFSIHTEKCQEEFAFGPLFLCILKINRAARELVPGIQVVVEEACFWGCSQAWGLRPCPKWSREQSSTSVTVSGTEKATEKEVFPTGDDPWPRSWEPLQRPWVQGATSLKQRIQAAYQCSASH